MKGSSCLHPILLRSGQYVPCGKCPGCRSKQRYDMSTRLWFETTHSPAHFFVTLTYADEYLPKGFGGKLGFSKSDVQKFLKRLRIDMERSGLGRLRYFLTCEYGDSESKEKYLAKYDNVVGRSHYHLILVCEKKVSIFKMRELLQKHWSFGRVQCNSTSMAAIQYCTMYALKDESYLWKDYDKGDPSKPFRLFSRCPGLGAGFDGFFMPWLNEYVFNDGVELRDRFDVSGRTRGIPRFYKDRLDPSVSEELKSRSMQWLEDNQEELRLTRERNSVTYTITTYDDEGRVFSKEDFRENNYDIDNDIINKRKSIRKLRKLAAK